MNAVTPVDETALMIRRVFKVDQQTLWNALTQPEAIIHWMGSKMAKPSDVSCDLRIGGAWSVEMIGNQTGERHKVSGEYLEIDAPHRVSFTWAWQSTPDRISRVTYALSPAEGGTTLTLTHDRLYDSTARDNHGRGWTASVETLSAWLGDAA